MVEFVERLDFLPSVIPHLKQTDSLTIEEINPRVIGYERHGILLYTWYNKQTKRPSAWKTLVSVYDTNKHDSRILFSHNDKIDIVNASVNSSFIILAFTVRERPANNHGDTCSDGKMDIFKSYIAEIAPQKRIFSLNIEWHTYQRVQFLYHTNASVKEIYMLFIHHKESIGLYCIPVAKLGDDGYVMSSQPKTDQIVRKFLWSKFDPVEQRLFFIQLHAQDEEQLDGAAMFSAIQFDQRGKYYYILNFNLPYCFNMKIMREKVQYYDRYLSHCISNSNLNFDVLTSNKGALMICYQHQQQQQQGTNVNGDITPKPEDDSLSICSSILSNYKVSYTVFCMHSGYSITCSVSFNLEVAIKSQILFTIFGDYLMALLPGHFVHLLDCGSEHEPVHHIFLSDSHCPTGPPYSSLGTLLSTANWDFVSAAQHTVHLFENLSQKSYKVAFNYKHLVKAFSTSHHASMRLAILHAAVVHIRDRPFTKKLIECLCQDPANLECSDLIQEYLVADAYARMKQQLGFALLKPFPFTCLDVCRGQVERDRENQRSTYLTYKKFNKDLSDNLLFLLKDKNTEFWMSLKLAVKFSHDANVKRFPLSSLTDVLSKQRMPFQLNETRSSKGSAPSSAEVIIKLADQASKFERGMGRNDERKTDGDQLTQLVVDNVSAHVLKCMPRENKSKVQNICAEYALCRGKVVKALWRDFTKIFGYSQENEVYKQPLEKTSKTTDIALFQMLERLFYNVKQLSFPQFKGMQDVFIGLGYRCLPNYLFMQYFKAFVFKASPEFVSRFVSEVPDNEETSYVKLDLISSLAKKDAKPIIVNWDHPVAKRFRIQDLVGKFDYVGMFSVGNAMMADTADGEKGAERFMPLETFLQLIQLEENSRNFASFRMNDDEWSFLVDSAQHELENITLR